MKNFGKYSLEMLFQVKNFLFVTKRYLHIKWKWALIGKICPQTIISAILTGIVIHKMSKREQKSTQLDFVIAVCMAEIYFVRSTGKVRIQQNIVKSTAKCKESCVSGHFDWIYFHSCIPNRCMRKGCVTHTFRAAIWPCTKNTMEKVPGHVL